ncbi:hypothetical protein QAD02_008991 [Eretmocerus hayati]|uniref:Uncharacterized protein n=1 Tax=Eretmocerus hayati TaxID=131215 RepID=A0ACC2N805_9HYME|nr:hypothetical protein QAD02_008991 [Eretmocerus hayati]
MSKELLVTLTMMVLHYYCVVTAMEALTGRHESYRNDFYVEKNSFFRLDQKITRKGKIMTAKCRPLYSSNLVYCNIGIEKLTESSTKKQESLCNVALWGNKSRDFNLNYFGDDRAVITYYEDIRDRQILKLHLIYIQSCDKIRFDLESELYSNIEVNDDYFDIFIANKERCITTEKCKIRYDQYGEQIGNPIPFLVGKSYVRVSPAISEKYFVLSPSPETKLSLVDESGFEKSLASFSKPYYYGSIFSEIDTPYSNSRGKYGICTEIESQSLSPHFPKKVRCVQYDSMGDLKLDEEIKISWNEMVLKVYNLPGDGIILLTSRCIYQEHYNTQENQREERAVGVWDEEISIIPNEEVEKPYLYKPVEPIFYYNCDGMQILTMHPKKVTGLLYQNAETQFQCDAGELYANVSENDEELCFQVACFYNDYERRLPNSSFARIYNFETICIHKILLGYTLHT